MLLTKIVSLLTDQIFTDNKNNDFLRIYFVEATYYYNVDRCVYNKMRSTGIGTFHLNDNGPIQFAADGVCRRMYNYRHSQWIENESVNWEIYRNINCSANHASTKYKVRYMAYEKNRLVPYSSANFTYNLNSSHPVSIFM